MCKGHAAFCAAARRLPSRKSRSIVANIASCDAGVMENIPARLKVWAKELKRDVVALWIAARDPRTPWHAKIAAAAAAAVAAYALSPIDLIPDFVPVLGYLDDLVIVPLGIASAILPVPNALMAEYRRVAARREGRPRSLAGAAVIALLWFIALVAAGWWLYDSLG